MDSVRTPTTGEMMEAGFGTGKKRNKIYRRIPIIREKQTVSNAVELVKYAD
jgi:hypothetical protein